MDYFDYPFPFITTAQGFNLIHVAVYLSIIFHQYRKIKQRPADDEKHFPNECESAYLTLFEIPHIVVAYLDALVWTIALGAALAPYDIELHFLIYHKTDTYLTPEERVNAERVTLFVYEHLFLAIGAGAAWAVAIIATMERRRKKRSIVADIA
ncbi:hypothetical protein AX16_008380 [Volvariella volvacea WC 439]|nr:hypothetical protein AX16_008380 [Volvariella volvacea WC 439]